MQDQKERSSQTALTLLAVIGIGTLTIVALWFVSYFCVSQPSSPLNLSDWKCGSWSAILVIGILVAGVFLISVAWRAINKRR